MRRFCSAFSRSFCAKRSLTVLAIETSADDYCAAIVNSSKNVLSHKRVSFDESQRKLRGILPSLSGQLHRSNINRLVDECIDEAGVRFDDLDANGATVKPGLVLCLKVGADKALALCREYNRNFIPIHHMRAHALVSRLVFDDVEFPFLCLLISGGHSILCVVKSAEHFEILGQAISMSPGEAIDKVARSAGIIPKIHYGSEVEEYAKSSSEFLRYVDRMPHVKGTDFDFTTIRHFFEHTLRNKKDINLNDFCANLQFIIAGHLCQKLVIAFQYLESTGAFESNQRKSLVVSGGVAANSVIRSSVEKIATHYGYNTRIPPKDLVVDNAVMCAWTAIEMILAGTNDYFPSDKLPSNVHVEAKNVCTNPVKVSALFFASGYFGEFLYIVAAVLVRRNTRKQQPYPDENCQVHGNMEDYSAVQIVISLVLLIFFLLSLVCLRFEPNRRNHESTAENMRINNVITTNPLGTGELRTRC